MVHHSRPRKSPRGAIIGRRAVPARISLADQPGEFCNEIAFSIGSETVASHRSCSDSVFRTPSADAHALQQRGEPTSIMDLGG